MSDGRRQADDLRRQMDEMDLEVLRAIERRARLAREMAKLREGGPPPLPVPPRDLLDRIEAAAGEELPRGAVRAIFGEIYAATWAIEAPPRVAYIAPEGGFCHAAARRRFGAGAQFLTAGTVAEALDEVGRGRADVAVVPMESSSEGTVQSSIFAVAETELLLVGQIEAAATLSLMSGTGNLADVDKLYATAFDRAACQRVIASALPRATVIDVRTPMVACQLAGEDHGSAAIVPEATGEAAGLLPARSNVGDAADLRVRYAVVSARPVPRSGDDTTALVFSLHDQPGALFDSLRHFAERGINLKKIQSRPMPGEKWHYLFYVEVTGHVTDRPIVTALEAIKRQARTLRVLGSFPNA